MALVRSIGRWTMTALVLNSIIGSGIFALPGVLNRLLGRPSPFAMIFAAMVMAIIMACVTEVASQFSEPEGGKSSTETRSALEFAPGIPSRQPNSSGRNRCLK